MNRVVRLVVIKVECVKEKGIHLGAFLRGGIECPTEIPRLSPGFLGLALVLLHRTLVDHIGEEKKLSSKRRFARIDMPDEYDVDMRFD